MKRIGITGHQGLRGQTARSIRAALREQIRAAGHVTAVSSLAEGSDQIFAEEVLDSGGTLLAVIPSDSYERSFDDRGAHERFRSLRARAEEEIELGFPEPDEEAYWAAGRRVVELSDEILAVWDGKPAEGLGGTADVVAFAREQGKPVTVIWPPGSTRG